MQKQVKKTQIMEYLGELVLSQFEKRTPAPVPEGITLEMLEDIAKRGHMVYLILGALLKLELPEEYANRFRGQVKNSILQTLMQVVEARSLQQKFEQAGIRNQVLKGVILKQLYPTPEMREMSDIDFMLYEESFEKAEEILAKAGYGKLQEVKHHAVFLKQPNLILEAHWALYDKNVDKGQYQYYKDNFRVVQTPGTQYTYEFSKEDFYIYMIAHMAKHFYENGCGIRNVADIYIYLKEYDSVLDKKYLNTELQKLGLAKFEEHMRMLAEIWLGKKEATEFYNQLFDYMVDCGIYGKGENGVWGQFVKDQAERGGSLKTWYYFPGIEYMKEHYPWLEKHTWLLPVAWVMRGINGIMNKGKREKKQQVFSMEQEKVETLQNIYRSLQLNFRK